MNSLNNDGIRHDSPYGIATPWKSLDEKVLRIRRNNQQNSDGSDSEVLTSRTANRRLPSSKPERMRQGRLPTEEVGIVIVGGQRVVHLKCHNLPRGSSCGRTRSYVGNSLEMPGHYGLKQQ